MIDWRNLQLLALANVFENEKEQGGEEYIYRKICRRYSKEFSTPLYVVRKMPPMQVLQDFFEDLFENMEESELYDSAMRVLTSDPQSKEAEEALIKKQIARWEKEEKEKKKTKIKTNKKTPLENVSKTFDFSEEENDYKKDEV